MHFVQTVCNRLVMPWSDQQCRGASHGLLIPAKSLLPCHALPISLHLPCSSMADSIAVSIFGDVLVELYNIRSQIDFLMRWDEVMSVYAMTAMHLIKKSNCLQKTPKSLAHCNVIFIWCLWWATNYCQGARCDLNARLLLAGSKMSDWKVHSTQGGKRVFINTPWIHWPLPHNMGPI